MGQPVRRKRVWQNRGRGLNDNKMEGRGNVREKNVLQKKTGEKKHASTSESTLKKGGKQAWVPGVCRHSDEGPKTTGRRKKRNKGGRTKG